MEGKHIKKFSKNTHHIFSILIPVSTNIFLILIPAIIIIIIQHNPKLHIFFNSNNDFQWGGITVFVAFLSVLVTVGNQSKDKDMQKQKLIAEQIAKSRIDWLHVTREYVSNYISYANRVYFQIGELEKLKNEREKENKKKTKKGKKEKNAHTNDEIEELQRQINDLIIKTELYYYEAINSFNPKERIGKVLDEYLVLTTQDGNRISRKCKIDLTAKVGRTVQKYFKKEWDKSKHEIITGEVAQPDEGSSFYIKGLYDDNIRSAEEFIKHDISMDDLDELESLINIRREDLSKTEAKKIYEAINEKKKN